MPVQGGGQVPLGVVAGLDEVVAVGGGGHLHLVEPGGHELQPGHLGCGVLHGHPVGTKVGVGDAPLESGSGRVVEVIDQNLLGQGEGPSEAFPPHGHPVVERGVDPFDQLDGGSGGDGHFRLFTSCGSVLVSGRTRRSRWQPTNRRARYGVGFATTRASGAGAGGCDRRGRRGPRPSATRRLPVRSGWARNRHGSVDGPPTSQWPFHRPGR